MPRPDYRKCRTCGRSTSECGTLSHTRQCERCGLTALAENVVGLHLKSGPPLDRWRRAMAASVGAVILDETGPAGQNG